MTPSYIQTIESLASQFPRRDVTLYFPDFDAEPPADCLNQTFGAPVGVEADNWPIYKDLPALLAQAGDGDGDGDLRMEHVCTIDLKHAPKLGAPAGARALQLYISNAGYNEAWQPGTAHTHVVVLSDAEVAAGPFKDGDIPARSQGRSSRRFTLVPVAVPSEVFGTTEAGTPLAELRKAIYGAPARLGGEPMWLQGDPDENEDFGYDEDDGGDDEDGEGDEGGDEGDEDGDDEAEAPRVVKPLGTPVRFGFFMQFDEQFADVNLGDCGIMYVTGGDAHWQCH